MITLPLPVKKNTLQHAADYLHRQFPRFAPTQPAQLLLKMTGNLLLVWDEASETIIDLATALGIPSILTANTFVTIATPLTGVTLTGSANPGSELIEIEPVATIAALTFDLEATDLLAIGSVKKLAFTQIVTALTMAASGAGGGTIKGAAITAAAVNTSIAYQKTASKTWRRLY